MSDELEQLTLQNKASELLEFVLRIYPHDLGLQERVHSLKAMICGEETEVIAASGVEDVVDSGGDSGADRPEKRRERKRS